MPDQDREAQFLQSLSQDPGAGVRCPSCPGFRVTFQADCVGCGRLVLACKNSEPGDGSSSHKPTSQTSSLCTNTELVPIVPVPQSANQAPPGTEENQAPLAHTRACRGRLRRSTISLQRNTSLQRPGAGRDGVLGSVQDLRLPASGTSVGNSIRIYEQSQYAGRLPSSSSRRSSTSSTYAQRPAGRPAVRLVQAESADQHGFNGVRTRKGVKGFLVEIRPPKWKKTIWLGTYTTSVEAAGAYDAGVFYTNKSNTKYNFRWGEGAFPPLPSHLRLDNPDDMEEIKLFVKKQAQAAAQRVGSSIRTAAAQPAAYQEEEEVVVVEPVAVADTTSAHVSISSGVHSTSSDGNAGLPTGPISSLTSPVLEFQGASNFITISMDLDYLGQENLVDYYLDLTQETENADNIAQMIAEMNTE